MNHSNNNNRRRSGDEKTTNRQSYRQRTDSGNNSSDSRNSSKTVKKDNRKTPVKIIPLGGLNEIGKNMTAFECSNDIFIVDCGLAFPDAEMLGVDIVIPDFTYIERNQAKHR